MAISFRVGEERRGEKERSSFFGKQVKVHQVKHQRQDKTRITQREVGSLIKTEVLSENSNPDMQKESQHREGFQEVGFMIRIYCYVSNRH